MNRRITAIIPGNAGKLQLRNCIEVTGHDDCLPFNADIYLNDKPAGKAYNDGWGAEANYFIPDKEMRKEIEELETTLKRTPFLTNFKDSFYSLPKVLDIMAEACISHNRRKVTIKPVKIWIPKNY